LELANSSSNTTVTATRPNTTVSLTVGGVARSSLLVLSRVRRRAGDILDFVVTLPATVGIALDFRNGSTTGTALLPGAKFPDQKYTTDGEVLSGRFKFVYSGSAWKYVESQIPA